MAEKLNDRTKNRKKMKLTCLILELGIFNGLAGDSVNIGLHSLQDLIPVEIPQEHFFYKVKRVLEWKNKCPEPFETQLYLFKQFRGLILGRGIVPVSSSFAVKSLGLGVRELKSQSLGFEVRGLKTRTKNFQVILKLADL